MSGTITDGWEYVWAAYLLTWVSLTVYGTSLFRRARQSQALVDSAASAPPAGSQERC